MQPAQVCSQAHWRLDRLHMGPDIAWNYMQLCPAANERKTYMQFRWTYLQIGLHMSPQYSGHICSCLAANIPSCLCVQTAYVPRTRGNFMPSSPDDSMFKQSQIIEIPCIAFKICSDDFYRAYELKLTLDQSLRGRPDISIAPWLCFSTCQG